jgi:hypothetical protein
MVSIRDKILNNIVSYFVTTLVPHLSQPFLKVDLVHKAVSASLVTFAESIGLRERWIWSTFLLIIPHI